ncbi:transposase [Komagataeibacter oboediens DSM 11826]|nr:transposase [Komagataeibacter oboediens DSM 11826]
MIAQWKRQAIENMASLFSGQAAPEATASPVNVEKLHAKID